MSPIVSRHGYEAPDFRDLLDALGLNPGRTVYECFKATGHRPSRLDLLGYDVAEGGLAFGFIRLQWAQRRWFFCFRTDDSWARFVADQEGEQTREHWLSRWSLVAISGRGAVFLTVPSERGMR